MAFYRLENCMHLLKERQRRILDYLLGKEYPVTIKTIAAQLHVSPRTVRYDLEALDYWMKNRGLVMKRVPKKGVWIPERDTVKRVLDEEASIDAVKAYRLLSPQERHRELLAILFSTDDRISISDLSEAVGVSKSTCYTDLESVRKWLDEHDLILDSKAHVGYKIVASEEAWRRGLIEYLYEITNSQQLMNMVTVKKRGGSRETRIDFLKSPEYHDMFSEVDLERMMTFIEALEARMDMTLMDSAYAALMIHIAIAVKRLREGEIIVMPEEQLNEMKLFDAFDVVAQVLDKMNFLHFTEVPEAEVGYITAHVIAARMRERKETYKHIQERMDERSLGEKERKMMDGILEVVTQRCTIDDAKGLKKDLEALLIEFM